VKEHEIPENNKLETTMFREKLREPLPQGKERDASHLFGGVLGHTASADLYEAMIEGGGSAHRASPPV
jgi:hypothetical protein